MASTRELPFVPDPTYRLPPEDEARLAYWVDKQAAEHLLSGLTPKERGFWMAEILSRPELEGRGSIPEVQPFGDVRLDLAVWNLYSRVRSGAGAFNRGAGGGPTSDRCC